MLPTQEYSLTPYAAAIEAANIEAAFDVEQVVATCKLDLSFLGAVVVPDMVTIPFPEYYQILYVTLLRALQAPNSFEKFALGFPRGHAKTSFAKLLIFACIFFTTNRFILVTGATQDLAKNIVKDVIDILDSPIVRSIFGNWREDMDIDRAELKMFRINGRKVVIAAAGCGTSIRGFNLGNERPDVMIFDDAQTRECAASIAESTTYQAWLIGTAMKAKAPDRCTYLYIGNMYRDVPMNKEKTLFTCALRNFQKSKHWQSFIVGAILQDGTALWEARHPLANLLAEYQHDLELGHADTYAAEVMNDPEWKPNLGFDPTKVLIRERNTDLHQGNFVIIDPAGKRKGSDDTSVGYYEVYDGVPFCTTLEASVMSSVQTAWCAIRTAVQNHCNLIVIENTAYQDALLEWCEYVMRQAGITGIQVLPINSGNRSKNARIIDSVREVGARVIGFTPTTLVQWSDQLTAFDATKDTNKDDILDNVAYAPKVLALYRNLMVLPSVGMMPKSGIGYVPSADDSTVHF